jgi:hypothetical protein
MEAQAFAISIPGEAVVYSNLSGDGYLKLCTYRGSGGQMLMSVGDRKPEHEIKLNRLSMAPEWRESH